MSIFSVPIEVEALTNGSSATFDALVDTGASYTVLPANVLTSLGVEPIETRSFEIGDESIVEYSIGEAHLGIGHRQFITVVVFGPEDASALLGATTLQQFGFAADTVNERLIEVPAIGL